MNVTEIILITFLVWQISAMPIPSWIATAFFGVDSEDFNEESDWAENKFSFENKKWSYILFSIEFVKGLLAISLLGFVHSESVLVFGIIPFEYILALVVILGHTFPLYNEFNRTKSMGAYFGVFAGLWLVPAVLSLLVFLLLWAVNKKVAFSSLIISLGSLVMITFILIDLNALVIASALSTLLVISNYQQKVEAIRV